MLRNQMRRNKLTRNVLFLLSFILISCSKDPTIDQTEEVKQEVKVIYGDDDRLDLYQVTDPGLLELADSTVALIQSSKVNENSDGTVNISLSSYKNNYNLCSSEPFAEQKTAAYCSGALVGKDLIITAGHCITSTSSCNRTKLVFGFGIKNSFENTPSNIPKDNIYSCKQIVRRVQRGDIDYAVIKLDREVNNHKPLKIYRGEALPNGTPLTVIGHPSGLPTKVASGGQIRDSNDVYYVTTLDTYGGNSGSAVFNSITGEIMGILVRGDEDFVYNNGCYISNRCKENECRGEDVTRIDLLADLIPEITDSVEDPAESRIYLSDQSMAIPDRNQSGIWSTISVDESPKGRKVLVSVEIEHTYIGDLQITLVDPTGRNYLLRRNQGGRQRNLSGTFGEDIATLSGLDGLSKIEISGRWSLKIVDTWARDTGILKSWKIEFQ